MPLSGGSGGGGGGVIAEAALLGTSTFDFEPSVAFHPPGATDHSSELDLEEPSAFEHVFRLQHDEQLMDTVNWDHASSVNEGLATKGGKADLFRAMGDSWGPPPALASTLSQQAGKPIYTTTSAGSSTLTPAQQERLRNIAMPSHLQLQTNIPVKHPSSISPASYKDPTISSPDSNSGQGGSRKRKSSVEAEEEEEDGSQPPGKKTAHNMIEKRYRTNLNDKIAALRDAVPSLRIMQKSARGEDTAGDREELGGLAPAHKLNKATVLSKATEYIRHLEKQNERMQQEMLIHRKRLAAFEKLLVSGSLGVQQQQAQISPFQFSPEFNPDSHSPSHDPQGMIQVPDEIRKLNSQINQQTYAIPHEGPPYRRTSGNGWHNGGFLGKMMVGSLAGLMIIEGFHETEKDIETPGTRGLFALPTQLLGRISRSFHSSLTFSVTGTSVPADQTLRYVKFLLLFGIVFYAFIPTMFASSPKQKDIRNRAASLTPAPSLASPIQARRQAWLTAIQTVWVPRHNFLLEAAALLLKMGKLSLRNTIGSSYYALLTGTTEEQEAARVKAWTIALDALLAGGDVEVSKSRLMLTLMASATLPQTPVHLMLQALHIRVLLWEIGNAGFNGFHIFHHFVARLARWKWHEAQQLYQLMVRAKNPLIEEIPEHLLCLLERDCDEVLNDSITQRAYNLAWNLPTTHNTHAVSNGMDEVVLDFAIRSPLDAVAAWYSTLILQRGLITAFTSSHPNVEDLQLAHDSAPIGSISHTRSIIALAILVPSRRGQNIAHALQAVLPSQRSDPIPLLMNTHNSAQNLPDNSLSLRCATAIAHLERTAADTSAVNKLVKSVAQLNNLSLLGFVAATTLLHALAGHKTAKIACAKQLEGLAANLRVWIGGRQGARCGLDRQIRETCSEKCIAITKSAVGMGELRGHESIGDAGYVSMEEGESVGDAC